MNPRPSSQVLRVHLSLLFIQVTFGGFHVFGKFVLGQMHPLALASLRGLGAVPILMVLAWRAHPALPSRRDLLHLALLGFLGIFTNQVLFIVGLSYTTASNAAILMPSIPVFTALAAAVLGIERLSLRRWTGVALAVAGAVVMLGVPGLHGGRGVLLGNALILLNCLSYGLYLVAQRPMLMRLPAVTVVGWAFLFGGMGTLAVGLPFLAKLDPAAVSASAWIGVAYIVLIPTVVNYSLNAWALHRSSPALVATYTTLQPVAATILAVMFLHETAGLAQFLGFCLIVGGLVLVSRGQGRIGDKGQGTRDRGH